MKPTPLNRPFAALLLAALTLVTTTTSHAQNAVWSGGTGDWNVDGNWTPAGVPGEGTNVSIGASANVTYSSPMVAPSIGFLTNQGGILNINAGGFVVGTNSNTAIFVTTTGTRFLVGASGVVSVPNGGVTFTTNATGSVEAGGSLSTGGLLIVGAGGNSSSGGGAASFTNRGTVTVNGLRINNNSGNPQTCLFSHQNGTATLGPVVIGRSGGGNSAPVTLGAEGLVISNGVVNMTSIRLGNNAHGTVLIAGGATTNSGWFTLTNATATRAARFIQLGGHFVNQGYVTNGATGTAQSTYTVNGGTNIIYGIRFGADGATTGISWFTNSGTMYVGAGGISDNGVNTISALLNPGGLLGAEADWTGSSPMTLGLGSFTIRAAALDSTARNINLTSSLGGAGPLIKTGSGTLTLGGTNSYTSSTIINEGTLALGASASLASSEIVVGTGSSFNVTGVTGGYTLPAAKTLAGSGSVNGDVTVASTAIINPGTNSAPATLALANTLNVNGGSILHFDLPTTPGPGNDRLVISGDLNAANANTIDISGGGLPGTVHTLIQYGGNFNGTLGNFAITGATGILSNDVAGKTISIIIQSAIRGPTAVAWLGQSTNSDWVNYGVTNWSNAGTPDFFVPGDSVTFSALGAARTNLNLIGNVAPASIVVDAAADYTFGGDGAISGSTGLAKTNTGTLTISTTNSYTGVTTVSRGVLTVNNLANGGSPSGIGAATAASGNLVVDGGTFRYTGSSVSVDRGLTVGSNGGVVDVSSSGQALTLGGVVAGSGALIKSGTGTLTINNGVNSFSGGTVISNGTLNISSAASAVGAGGITNVGATLRISSAMSLARSLDVSGSATLDLANVGGDAAINGAWSGSGTITIIGQQPAGNRTFTFGGSGDAGGNMTNFSGTLNCGANDGNFRFNDSSNGNFGSTNAVFDIGTSTATLLARNGGITINLGELRGGPGTKLSGRGNGTAATLTWSIGGKGTSSTFEGTIQDSANATAITKVGGGTLTLTGTSTHTGATVVNNGVLMLTGALGNTPVTVAGGILAGTGAIAGTVDVQAAGALSPGNNGIGTLVVNNALTLAGKVFFELNTTNGVQTNDQLTVTSATFGGDLTVSNSGPALLLGDRFVLFSGSVSGAFAATNLPALGSGLVWDTTQLGVDGSIIVASGVTVNPNPTNVTATVSGADLTLNWPASHIGWTLQVQTNARSVGLTVATNTWFDVAGSDATNSVTIPTSKANATVFYRLRLPQP